MKYLVLLISISILSCNGKGKKEGEAASFPIRFDGIYQSAIQTNKSTGDQSTSYLRFYKDGTVINVSSSGTPEQISKWFEKGNASVSEGHYTIDRDSLSFTSSGNNVIVDNNGKIINKGLLQLHTKSLSNNYESDIDYSFVALSGQTD